MFVEHGGRSIEIGAGTAAFEPLLPDVTSAPSRTSSEDKLVLFNFENLCISMF